MSLWAVMFLEYWKRMNATLTYQWDCSEFEDIEVWPLSTYTPAAKTEHWPMVHFRLCLLQERPRPQFTAMAPMMTKNLITGKDEPYFPKRNRFNRIVAGSMVIIMMVRELLSWVEMWGLEQEWSWDKRALLKTIITTHSAPMFLQIAVVMMFLVSIILYRIIIAIVVSRSGNFLVVASVRHLCGSLPL